MSQHLQNKVQTLLNTLVQEGKERGAQVAVYIDGRLLVDAWAGVADVRTGTPVDGDTLFPIFSTTKGIQATAMHILAERCKLDYEKPVAFYWPEFAANGKGTITVRHTLAHSAGLPWMPLGVDHKELCDWDTMCRLVAEMTPASAPGAKTVYHAVTSGWILGEVARRIDGRAFQPFIEQEICKPLGITHMFAGIPAELESKVAYLELLPDPNAPTPQPGNPAEQTISPCMNPLHEWMNRSDARRACIPASNGIMNARAIARHWAALLPGGVEGVSLLPPDRIRIATQLQIPTEGFVEGVTPRRGLGYALNDGGLTGGFGHGGYGGSAGWCNHGYRLAVGITRNQFSSSSLNDLVLREIKTELGIPL